MIWNLYSRINCQADYATDCMDSYSGVCNWVNLFEDIIFMLSLYNWQTEMQTLSYTKRAIQCNNWQPRPVAKTAWQFGHVMQI